MGQKRRNIFLFFTFCLIFIFLCLFLFNISRQDSSRKAKAKRPPANLTEAGLPLSGAVNPPLFQLKKLARFPGEKDSEIKPQKKILRNKEVRNKIDADLLKALSGVKVPEIKLRDKEGRIRYTVHLKEQLFSKKEDVLKYSRIKEKNNRVFTLVSQLQTFSQNRQAGIKEFLLAKGEEVKFISYWVFNGLSVSSDEETLLALANRPEVEKITPLRIISPPEPQPGKKQKRVKSEALAISSEIEWNIAAVKADFAWALGTKGEGIVVGSMDTGVDISHEILRNRYRGFDPQTGQTDHNYNWFDASGGLLIPEDNHGHGTHTVGTAVGEQGYGVAPEAKFIAARVFAPHGTDEDFHRAFQWLLSPCDLQGENCRSDLAPDVVINSWAYLLGGVEEFFNDVLAWRAAGIFPEFSAGNWGSDEGTIASPADYPQSFATGAVDISREVAGFSSRGPSIYGEIKPEVTAPGVDVCSSFPGGYHCWSGTSMAGPHTAGAVALLKELKPDITVDELEELLKSTAVDLGRQGPDNDYGWGELNLYQAASQIAPGGTVSGQVQDSSDPGKTVAEVIIKAKNQKEEEITTQSKSDGSFRFFLSAGTWKIAAMESFWYLGSSWETVNIEEGADIVKNLLVDKRPTGDLEILVKEEKTEIPLSQVSVKILDTPAKGETDSTGKIHFSLPPDSYHLEVRPKAGHEVKFDNVNIIANQNQSISFSLKKIKKILRAGQPQDAPQAKNRETYYQKAYDAVGWAYDFIPLSNLTLSQMLAYDVVHLSPYDSYLGSWGWNKLGEIKDYLNKGKALFLDAGTEAFYEADEGSEESLGFLHQYLHANFETNDYHFANVNPLGIFQNQEPGLIGHSEAYNQGLFWDVISPRDPFAQKAAEYERPGNQKTAGLSVILCPKVVFLSFNLINLGPLNARKGFIQQAINWLTTDISSDFGVAIAPPYQSSFAPRGGMATYSTQILNVGKEQDSYELSVLPIVTPVSPTPKVSKYMTISPDDSGYPRGVGWPATVKPTETGMISSCGSVPATVNVFIPSSPKMAPYGIGRTTRLTAFSQNSPPISTEASMMTVAFPNWQ
jgi:hypothetical protein